MRGQVRQAVIDLLGDRQLAEPSADFKPQVSATYYHADAPPSAFVARLANMRTKSDTIEVPVPGAFILEIWRKHRLEGAASH